MRRTRALNAAAIATAAAALAATGLALTVAPAEPAGAAPAARHDDFDGDGHRDVAVGVPRANGGAGAVTVSYGAAGGLSPARTVRVGQATAGVPGSSEPGDAFGASVTSGDVDFDGYADLIVGAPGERLTGKPDGRVTILWGGPRGLRHGAGVLDSPGGGDRDFARGVSFADLDGDGYGQLQVVSGNNFWWYAEGVDGDGTDTAFGLEFDFLPEDVELRGLVAGHFTGTQRNDFALYGTRAHGGAYLAVLRGGPGDIGLNHTVLADDPYQAPVRAAAAGDVNGDDLAELVLGIPGALHDGSPDPAGHGIVAVWRGDPEGLTAHPTEVYLQDREGVPGHDEPGDAFGASVSVRDVTGDGRRDIAVGVPGEDVRGVVDAGAVVLLKGAAGGVSPRGAQTLHQASAGVPGAAERGDRFGAAVHLADATGDGRADLALGAPGEDIGDRTNAGAVWLLRGSSAGLTATGSAAFNPTDLGFSEVRGLRYGSVFDR